MRTFHRYDDTVLFVCSVQAVKSDALRHRCSSLSVTVYEGNVMCLCDQCHISRRKNQVPTSLACVVLTEQSYGKLDTMSRDRCTERMHTCMCTIMYLYVVVHVCMRTLRYRGSARVCGLCGIIPSYAGGGKVTFWCVVFHVACTLV